MNIKVKMIVIALAAMGAVTGAQMLATSAYAHQGPEATQGPGGQDDSQGGPQGFPGGRGHQGPEMAHNDKAKVTITAAISAAANKVAGYVNEARLVGRPEEKQWIVHVVTKAATKEDQGKGKFVIVDAKTGSVAKVLDQPPMRPGGPEGGPEGGQRGGRPEGGPGGEGGPVGGPGGGDQASTTDKQAVKS